MKQSKLDVSYRDYPMRGERCGTCHMFLYPDACTAVHGDIRSSGWCTLHAAGEPRERLRQDGRH